VKELLFLKLLIPFHYESFLEFHTKIFTVFFITNKATDFEIENQTQFSRLLFLPSLASVEKKKILKKT